MLAFFHEALQSERWEETTVWCHGIVCELERYWVEGVVVDSHWELVMVNI